MLIRFVEPLDELADMVASLFSLIPNRGREPLHMIADHPFGPNEMGVSFEVHWKGDLVTDAML